MSSSASSRPAALGNALTNANAEAGLHDFSAELSVLFAKLPYDIHLPLERYYQSLIYLVLTLLGYQVDVEVRTNRGRIDAVRPGRSDVPVSFRSG